MVQGTINAHAARTPLVQPLWTTLVQSMVVMFRDLADVCLVGFPDMHRTDDFNRGTKGGEPSEKLGLTVTFTWVSKY